MVIHFAVLKRPQKIERETRHVVQRLTNALADFQILRIYLSERNAYPFVAQSCERVPRLRKGICQLSPGRVVRRFQPCEIIHPHCARYSPGCHVAECLAYDHPV